MNVGNFAGITNPETLRGTPIGGFVPLPLSAPNVVEVDDMTFVRTGTVSQASLYSKLPSWASADQVVQVNTNLPRPQAAWHGVSFGASRFCAISRVGTDISPSGACAISTDDGVTWTEQVLPTLPDGAVWSHIEFAASLFVIVPNFGTTYATSPDGITWTVRSFPRYGIWRGVRANNGVIIIIGAYGNVLRSTDLINWTFPTISGTSPLLTSPFWAVGTYGNDFILATVSSVSNVFQFFSGSGGGSTFTAATQLTSVIGGSAISTNGFLTIPEIDTAFFSIEGDETLGNVAIMFAYTLSSNSNINIYGYINTASYASTISGVYVVGDNTISNDGTFSASNQPCFVRKIGSEYVYSSIQGEVITKNSINAGWGTSRGVRSSVNAVSLWIAGGNGKFVGVGGPYLAASHGLRSFAWSTTSSWTGATRRALPKTMDIGVNTINNTCLSGDRTIVAGGNGSSVSITSIYSDDGQNWRFSTLPAQQAWVSCAGNGSVVVAIAANGSTAYSTNNGETWTSGALPTGTAWFNVAWGGGNFVAAQNNASTWATSTDGINWTTRSGPVMQSPNIIFDSVSWIAFSGSAEGTTSFVISRSTNGGTTWSVTQDFSPLFGTVSSVRAINVSGRTVLFSIRVGVDFVNSLVYTTDGGVTFNQTLVSSSLNGNTGGPSTFGSGMGLIIAPRQVNPMSISFDGLLWQTAQGSYAQGVQEPIFIPTSMGVTLPFGGKNYSCLFPLTNARFGSSWLRGRYTRTAITSNPQGMTSTQVNYMRVA